MRAGKCPICGGKTTMKRVDVTESVGNRLVVVKSVEAEVCTQCGERLYSESTMRKLDSLMQKVKSGSAKPESKRELEVYALSH
ncbi:MAG: type II toxin-antitoxin system MqsA family antitoxin [Thaumarchaeota archaeon]|nr:type II toxin-antitoxin system MqsA family antitoxin [Nitrososphaerota archaeon]